MQFINDAGLVIHNAPFDLHFLDSELERLGRKPVFKAWPGVIDTLMLARAKGLKRASLKNICAHYQIPFDPERDADNLEMVEAIARVYLAMEFPSRPHRA